MRFNIIGRMSEAPLHTKGIDVQGLVEEFRGVIENCDYPLPLETQAVVALSAPSDKFPDGRVKEHNREMISRIWFAVQLCRDIAAKRQEVSLEEADTSWGPRLILTGWTEQVPAMEAIAVKRLKFPIEMIDEIDCGSRGVGNTKIQMEILRDDPRFTNLRDITFVTTAYHKPRVDRTADAVLDQSVNVRTIAVPYDAFKFNVFRKVRGEVKRILEYSKRGDISMHSSKRVM
jgi:hypothetical protein